MHALRYSTIWSTWLILIIKKGGKSLPFIKKYMPFNCVDQDNSMGLRFGLENDFLAIKRKFRWLFKIPNISASGINSLPPKSGARPSLQFKEAEVQHLNETVYYPMKPDWK